MGPRRTPPPRPAVPARRPHGRRDGPRRRAPGRSHRPRMGQRGPRKGRIQDLRNQHRRRRLNGDEGHPMTAHDLNQLATDLSTIEDWLRQDCTARHSDDMADVVHEAWEVVEDLCEYQNLGY